MILLLGSDEDKTLAYFGDFLSKNGKKFKMLNQKFLLSGIDISNEFINFNDKRYYLDEFSGVLNRMSWYKDETGNLPSKIAQCFAICNSIVSLRMKNVLNPSYLGVSNDSKLYQITHSKVNTIKIPDHTVLANCNIEDNTIADKHVVKSLSSIRSIAVDYESSKESFPLQKHNEPVLFQQLIQGNNVRVHVVDEECFPIKIIAKSVDYRYDKSGCRSFTMCDLPEIIRKECIQIAKNHQLRFCGIDLIHDYKNDTYYLLEVNPSPGWTFFEEEVGNFAISTKLAQVLYGD